MELTLQILLGIVSLICLLGGINLLLKGANYFLTENIPPQRVLVKVGFASKYLDYIMIVEIVLGIAIILLQYFRLIG